MKTNVGRGPVLCLAICETVLKNIRKKYLRISPKCRCFLIVVMSQNFTSCCSFMEYYKIFITPSRYYDMLNKLNKLDIV